MEDSNISNGLLQVISPRFNTIIERSQTIPPKPIPPREVTATSLSEMHLMSSETVQPSTPRAPNVPIPDNAEIPLTTSESPSKFARFAFLAK